MHKIDEDPLRVPKPPPLPESAEGNACLGIVIGLIFCTVFYGTLILVIRSC